MNRSQIPRPTIALFAVLSLVVTMFGAGAHLSVAHAVARQHHHSYYKTSKLQASVHPVVGRLVRGTHVPLRARGQFPAQTLPPANASAGPHPTARPPVIVHPTTAKPAALGPLVPNGIVTNTFQAATGPGSFPPDPTLAVGPFDIVALTNNGIQVFDKNGDPPSGTPPLSQPLVGTPANPGFFDPLGAVATNQQRVGDPHGLFDEYLQRFWVIAISQNDGPDQSHVLVALSNTNDAFGTWRFFQFDTNEGNNGNDLWCDYPELGIDTQAMYFTCNQLDHPRAASNPFEYASIRVFTKQQFLGGPCCSGTEIFDLHDDLSDDSRTIQPAHMRGAQPSDGEYFINAEGQGGSGNEYHIWRMADPFSPSLDDTDEDVHQYDPPPVARQPNGVAGVDAGDTQLLSAVWFHGHLITTQTTYCGGGDCAAYTELDVSGWPATPKVNDWLLQENFEDLFYPSVDVNASDTKVMVYARSDTTTPPSAFAVKIPPSSQCINCFSSESVVQRGINTYLVTDPSGRNRWGDYYGASADPDGVGIWVHGEATGTAPNRYVTTIGLTLEQPDLAPPQVTAQVFPAPNANGWNNTGVLVLFQATDDRQVRFITFSESGAQTQGSTKIQGSSGLVAILAEGQTNVSYSATDTWGNVSLCQPCVAQVKIDETPPIITINQPTATAYPHSATLTLDYSAFDQVSGVGQLTATMDGSTTVGGQGLASGQAINLLTELSLGPHTFTVQAVDLAGNSSTVSVTFTILVTAQSIQADVSQFVASGQVTLDAGDSLLRLLQAAAAARADGDCAQADKIYQAFINELLAQSGKHVTATAAAIMITDAQYLITHCP